MKKMPVIQRKEASGISKHKCYILSDFLTFCIVLNRGKLRQVIRSGQSMCHWISQNVHLKKSRPTFARIHILRRNLLLNGRKTLININDFVGRPGDMANSLSKLISFKHISYRFSRLLFWIWCQKFKMADSIWRPKLPFWIKYAWKSVLRGFQDRWFQIWCQKLIVNSRRQRQWSAVVAAQRSD